MSRPACPRQRRSGFTLIELLTVVAIISLLIGILLPSLSRAREQAKKARVAGLLSAVEKGLEMFQNDFNQYPDSRRREDPIDWTGSPFASSTPNRRHMSGAHWLARALAGADMRGPDTPGDTLKSWGDFTSGRQPKYTDLVDASKNIERKGPYLEGEVFARDDDKSRFPGAVRDPEATGRLVVFEDAFNSPVLYYRANPRARNAFCGLGGTAADPDGIYTHADNAEITGGERPSLTTTGWDFAGTVGSSGSGDPVHKLGIPGWSLSGGQQVIDDRQPQSFARYLANQSALKATGQLKPVNADRFILITAGRDGIYGTTDDVSNFKSGL